MKCLMGLKSVTYYLLEWSLRLIEWFLKKTLITPFLGRDVIYERTLK